MFYKIYNTVEVDNSNSQGREKFIRIIECSNNQKLT